MRYFGKITGKIRNHEKEKIYMAGEEPEKWDKYEFEIENIYDEEGTQYGTKYAKVSYKTALRMASLITADNKIAFDCSGFEGDIILKIRNWCPTLIGVGLISTKKRFEYESYFDLKESNSFFGKNENGLTCLDCKYRNNKKLCSKYKVK